MIPTLLRRTWLAAASIAIAGLLPLLAVGTVTAYGQASGNWDSLGCAFNGFSSASTVSGYSYTENYGCAERVRIKMDYKTGGNWYSLGEYWDYTGGSWLVVSKYRNYDTEMVFGTHQIYVSGDWRQEENTMTW